MKGFEKFFVLWAIGYMIVYVPTFMILMASNPEQFFFVILPFHLLGMAQNLVALILTVRDLYLRPFPDPNQKVTWALLILMTGGIGLVVYLFKYAFKPRTISGSDDQVP